MSDFLIFLLNFFQSFQDKLKFNSCPVVCVSKRKNNVIFIICIVWTFITRKIARGNHTNKLYLSFCSRYSIFFWNYFFNFHFYFNFWFLFFLLKLRKNFIDVAVLLLIFIFTFIKVMRCGGEMMCEARNGTLHHSFFQDGNICFI